MCTYNTVFTIKKENPPKLSQICRYEILLKGLKNEFEIVMVNKPSVSMPLEVYCTDLCNLKTQNQGCS